MVIPRVAICPICGKKTYLRIEDGSYLNEYPIRINCMNCRALIKGVYIMNSNSNYYGLHLFNANVEDCDVDVSSKKIRNADYVVNISGEIPCKNVQKFNGNLIYDTPFLYAADNMESIEERKKRLSYFTKNMEEWKRKKSTAFQLLNEGSIKYIARALNNKMGDYTYECDNYLKSFHCLQEVALEETKYIFSKPEQDIYVRDLINALSQINKEKIHQLSERIGGIQELIYAYRKVIEVFNRFMDIYPNLLPAETFMRFNDQSDKNLGISTCSFSDIKSFYQDSYEVLLSLIYIPVCLDNIKLRGDYQIFSSAFNKAFNKRKYSDLGDDFQRYCMLDNGFKSVMIVKSEPIQRFVNFSANKDLRNGIGHNNIKYDGVTQKIICFDLKDHSTVKLKLSLMEMAIQCIGLVKSAIMLSEIILFLLREEFRSEDIRSIVHPRFYNKVSRNDWCPCGSHIKYKKCCLNDVERVRKTK